MGEAQLVWWCRYQTPEIVYQKPGIVEQMENTRYQIEHTRVAGWVRQLGGGGMVGHSLALHGAAHIYHTPLAASPCHHYLIITLPNLH